LRGRSGRQGDPGTSKFFISLEDDLMRLFGSDRITNVMSRMGMEEGEAIQHPLITRSVGRAQKKVEENNFAIRKRLLEYDNVMNQQREVIYARRRQALEGERLKGEIFEYMEEYIQSVVNKYYDEGEIESIQSEILQALLVDIKLDTVTFEKLGKDGVIEKITETAKDFYKRKEEMIGSELMARLERYAVLSVIDDKWKEHLREMDDLKEGIGLRAYGQKDPLLEYKAEAYNLFVILLDDIRNEVVGFCFKFWPQAPAEVQGRKTAPAQKLQTIKDTADNLGLRAPNPDEDGTRRGKQMPVKVEEKVGRNEPCPCGSGKKFKNCHGKIA
jgi:preprotein translocase subunit SecA